MRLFGQFWKPQPQQNPEGTVSVNKVLRFSGFKTIIGSFEGVKQAGGATDDLRHYRITNLPERKKENPKTKTQKIQKITEGGGEGVRGGLGYFGFSKARICKKIQTQKLFL